MLNYILKLIHQASHTAKGLPWLACSPQASHSLTHTTKFDIIVLEYIPAWHLQADANFALYGNKQFARILQRWNQLFPCKQCRRNDGSKEVHAWEEDSAWPSLCELQRSDVLVYPFCPPPPPPPGPSDCVTLDRLQFVVCRMGTFSPSAMGSSRKRDEQHALHNPASDFGSSRSSSEFLLQLQAPTGACLVLISLRSFMKSEWLQLEQSLSVQGSASHHWGSQAAASCHVLQVLMLSNPV